MRFYEFASPAKPVLKISHQAQTASSATTPPTPLPQNTQPTATHAEPASVCPRAWQREWLQKYLAAQMARTAQPITPTEDDLAIASKRYREA